MLNLKVNIYYINILYIYYITHMHVRVCMYPHSPPKAQGIIVQEGVERV